jgi:hypothetical protein
MTTFALPPGALDLDTMQPVVPPEPIPVIPRNRKVTGFCALCGTTQEISTYGARAEYRQLGIVYTPSVDLNQVTWMCGVRRKCRASGKQHWFVFSDLQTHLDELHGQARWQYEQDMAKRAKEAEEDRKRRPEVSALRKEIKKSGATFWTREVDEPGDRGVTVEINSATGEIRVVVEGQVPNWELVIIYGWIRDRLAKGWRNNKWFPWRGPGSDAWADLGARYPSKAARR